MWPFDRGKKAFIRGLGKGTSFTKDMPVLEQQHHHLVFLYDDMMRPHKNYELIKDNSVKVGRGFTQQPFDLRITKHNAKAVAFIGNEGLKLKGELHAVQTRHMPILDNHYKNGVEFARVPVNILVTDRNHQLMSIGNEEFLRNFPKGMIRTVPELGLRHYVSIQVVCVISAKMYVGLKSHWNDEDHNLLRRPIPEFPKDNIVWLPKYYRYPIERNKCPSRK